MASRPPTAAARERIAAALADGQVIDAINIYRKDTLCSLVEARAAVEAMSVSRTAGPVMPARDDALTAEILAGRKIQAIKLYREVHHVDLKTAKDAVEAIEATMRRNSPGDFPAAPSTGSGGCSGWIIFLLLAAAFVLYALWKMHRL